MALFTEQVWQRRGILDLGVNIENAKCFIIIIFYRVGGGAVPVAKLLPSAFRMQAVMAKVGLYCTALPSSAQAMDANRLVWVDLEVRNS